MTKYDLAFSRSAKRDLETIDNEARRRIGKKLLFYIDQEDPVSFARKLIHSKIGSYRFRVGHYRIVFDVHNNVIEVVSVKHRRDVYKN